MVAIDCRGAVRALAAPHLCRSCRRICVAPRVVGPAPATSRPCRATSGPHVRCSEKAAPARAVLVRTAPGSGFCHCWRRIRAGLRIAVRGTRRMLSRCVIWGLPRQVSGTVATDSREPVRAEATANPCRYRRRIRADSRVAGRGPSQFPPGPVTWDRPRQASGTSSADCRDTVRVAAEPHSCRRRLRIRADLVVAVAWRRIASGAGAPGEGEPPATAARPRSRVRAPVWAPGRRA